MAGANRATNRARIGALVTAGAVSAVMFAACALTGVGTEPDKGSVTVGAVTFAENQIIAEMYAQVLEDGGYEVERRMNLASREVLEPALTAGKVDVAPEYLATLLTFLEPSAEASSDPLVNARRLDPVLAEIGVELLEPSAANDTNALVVTEETAAEFDLSDVSDLRPIDDMLVFGGPPECPERPFCLPGLERVYGIHFRDFKELDAAGPITIAALEAEEIDVALLFSTSGVIARRGWIALADDKELQAADNITPVVRQEVLDQTMRQMLNEVSARLTTSNVTELNARVEVDNEDPADVARDFLEEQSLL